MITALAIDGLVPRYTPLTADEMRELTRRFLLNATTYETQRYWDLVTALRGPDSPSETPDMTKAQRDIAYEARRKRKAQGVEVIRHHAFHGAMAGSARSRSDRVYITLPPMSQWDHHDVHLRKAAKVLGLVVKEAKETPKWKRLWSQIVQRLPQTGIAE